MSWLGPNLVIQHQSKLSVCIRSCAPRSTAWVMARHTCHSLPPNWVRLAPNGTNLGLFKIRFSTFWLAELKSPRFVPLGTNTGQFGVNPDNIVSYCIVIYDWPPLLKSFDITVGSWTIWLIHCCNQKCQLFNESLFKLVFIGTFYLYRYINKGKYRHMKTIVKNITSNQYIFGKEKICKFIELDLCFFFVFVFFLE